MVLKIKLGKKREKRLKKHLEKEHPSTRGNTSLDNEMNSILGPVPDYEKQLKDFTKV